MQFSRHKTRCFANRWKCEEEYAAASKEPALHQAFMESADEESRALINTGSDVNGKNFSGMTPLHCAARLCNVELVKLLLEKGADANATIHKTKKPGCYSALALLAEASHRELRWENVRATGNCSSAAWTWKRLLLKRLGEPRGI